MPLLLSPGPMHNQSGSKLVGGFFGSWVRESGKKICNTTHIAQHNAIHIVHTTQYSVQHKHIEKHPHSAYLHRRRKIFFSMWAKHSENQICVRGDIVLFIMFFLNYNK